jgi:preprotein translocase subunit SecA
VENHRQETYGLRREILLSLDWTLSSMLPEEQYRELVEAAGLAESEELLQRAGREMTLATLDDLWADYLANVAELRGGIHWVSWGGRDPLYEFLTGVEEIYSEFQECLKEELADALAAAELRDGEIHFENREGLERGATWTYLTTDQPFGTLGERVAKGLRRRFKRG